MRCGGFRVLSGRCGEFDDHFVDIIGFAFHTHQPKNRSVAGSAICGFSFLIGHPQDCSASLYMTQPHFLIGYHLLIQPTVSHS